jgi:hypothetical protein
VIDLATLRSWIEALGYDTTAEGTKTLRLHPRSAQTPAATMGDPERVPQTPPFLVQLGENWLLLSMLPMATRGTYRAEDLGRRLLAQNREMRLCKFALDRSGAVVLCAELPTESLDASEVGDAVERMMEYARWFADEIGRPA